MLRKSDYYKIYDPLLHRSTVYELETQKQFHFNNERTHNIFIVNNEYYF